MTTTDLAPDLVQAAAPVLGCDFENRSAAERKKEKKRRGSINEWTPPVESQFHSNTHDIKAVVVGAYGMPVGAA